MRVPARLPDRRGGMALVAVLLALLALLVLCTPFLLTARNASKSSSQLADRVQGRLALDAAERHARASLGASHLARDETPYWDGLDEVAVDTGFDPDFWDVHDPRGVMWDVHAVDVASRIDLNSAGPHVIANVLGATTRLVRPVPEDETKELPVSGTRGFDDEGILYVEGELVAYSSADGSRFTGLLRGLAAEEDEEGEGLPCGPQVPADLPAGAPVLDVRAFAPVRWRIGAGEYRTFSFPEEVREAGREFGFGLEYDGRRLESLAGATTVFAGAGAGPVWQRPARVRNDLEAGLDCGLDVDEIRWFNPGTTVRITDGRTTEYGIVRSIENNEVKLVDAVVNDYFAFTAVVAPLARRPVNLNTAPPEVLALLFENLQWSGANDRITGREARNLAAVVVESRPFEGHEDFLRRVVLPAAGLEPLPEDAPVRPAALEDGGTLIAAYDALALYANALNANDARLAFSTMPFSFTTRDVYDLELRASVNAPSGVERVSGLRHLVERIVPQGELLRLWTRQADFDEELRLTREAPWWSTGPEATARHDSSVRLGGSPASRMWPHFGTAQGQVYVPGVTELPETSETEVPVPQHVFASREEDGWAQLWASRVVEVDELQGHVMHFDHDTTDPEGRFLPEETVELSTDDPMLGWTDPADPLLRGFDASFWFRPEALTDSVLLDVGSTSLDGDRVVLQLQGPDLVLQVFDGPGDHPGTSRVEAGEARFALAPGDGPGLAQSTWTHVAIDVRGNRPDQLTMLVDGRSFGVRYPGLTRAPGGAADGATTIPLEDDEGFDAGVGASGSTGASAACVVRMGEEVIEGQLVGGALQVGQSTQQGPLAGFGGRLARDKLNYVNGQPVSEGIVKDTDHGPGASVQLYGYDMELASNVPGGQGSLASDVGLFRVGVVEGIGFGNPPGSGGTGEPVVMPEGCTVGVGVDASAITSLVVRPADGDPIAADYVRETFDENGGYAALVQTELGSLQCGLQVVGTVVTTSGQRVGGIEIVQYSGYQDDVLFVTARGVQFQNTAAVSGTRAFVVNWNVTTNQGANTLNDFLNADLFILPISVNVQGVGGAAAFLPPQPNQSEFAQITERGANAGLTEWIRYDEIVGDFLVRNDASFLQGVQGVLATGVPSAGPLVPPGPIGSGGSGGSGGSNGPGGGNAPGPAAAPVAPGFAAPRASPAGAAQTTQGGSYWTGEIGVLETPYADGSMPLSQAVMDALQFRGVMGTFAHAHTVGTAVLPVFRAFGGTVDTGLPGRLDPVFLVDADVQDLGWDGVIHWAHNPRGHRIATWALDPSDPLRPVAGTPALAVQSEIAGVGRGDQVYVALQRQARIPLPAGRTGSCVSPASVETRCRSRLVKFPSGERPRVVTRAVVGASLRGGSVPAAVADELVFGSTPFGDGGSAGASAQGAALTLLQQLPDGETTLRVQPNEVRVAAGRHVDFSKDFLADLPQDGGLLRIGEEILAYESIDATSGTITIPVGGRGLLGTVVQHHGPGDLAIPLDRQDVAILTAGVDTSDSVLPVSTLRGFPPNGGTVLVGDEVMHYTRVREGALEMPRLSEEPGAMDGRGPGAFRGRYGSAVQGHASGQPVVLLPFRYWDRWTDRADGPELAYQGFALNEPAAFWRGVFWEDQAPPAGGASLEVLCRTDPSVPWDADPERTDGLDLFTLGLDEGRPNGLGRQSDLAEFRVFVRYAPGAFDSLTGLNHGWKQTPRLRTFGATFLAPYTTLRRVDE